MQKLEALRKEYSKADLDVTDVMKNPIEQFEKAATKNKKFGSLVPVVIGLVWAIHRHTDIFGLLRA